MRWPSPRVVRAAGRGFRTRPARLECPSLDPRAQETRDDHLEQSGSGPRAVSGRSPEPFDLPPGTVLAGGYRVESLAGGGWEGEVYRVVEARTGIVRAAKLFYPERNPANRTVARYARKLERLRDCRIVMRYHHSEELHLGERTVTCLLSDFVPGAPLPRLVARSPGGRLAPFEAMHLLHALVAGLEQIHDAGLYHGDLHEDNVLVRRRGIRFEVRVLDFFHRGRPSRAARQMDVVDAVKLFYDLLGGRRHYARQPAAVKAICRGLRHRLILDSFPTATHLRRHLETFSWS